MGMTLHVLSAGKGYQYLTKSIVSGDVQRKPGQTLSNYYAGEHGTPPGQWCGKGAQSLGLSGQITEEQISFLYGKGMHPNSKENIEKLVAEGKSFEQAQKAQYLGNKYALYEARRGGVIEDICKAIDSAEKELGRVLTKEEESDIGIKVGRKQFTEKFGRPPEDSHEVERWIWTEEKRARTSTAGYDATFSPSKSISVLWALGDEEIRRAIEIAHNKAVDHCINLIEKEAAFSRTGHNGIQIDTEGITVSKFMHYDTRAGDMDLHTHCVISNKVLCVDGKYRALDGRALFNLSAVAGSEYNSVLTNELRNSLGVSFVAIDHGKNKQAVQEIAGIDPVLIEQFSKRSQTIEKQAQKLYAEYREKYGREPSDLLKLQLRQQANIETRQAKDEVPHSFNELNDKWSQEACRTLGIPSTQEELQNYLKLGLQNTFYTPKEFNKDEIISNSLKKLSAKRAHWRIGHLHTAINYELQYCHFKSEELRKEAQQLCIKGALENYAIALPSSGRAHSVDTSRLTKTNGESIFHAHMSQEYASPEVILQEKNVFDGLECPIADVLTREQVDKAIVVVEEKNGYPLNNQQRELVHHFTGTGTLVAGGIGPAGTGKTTAMRAVSDAWIASGRNVVALGTSAAAAQILGAELGTSHTTIADLLVRSANNLDIPVRQGTMLLVDEAGMSSTRELSEIVDLARQRGAVVRLLGDPRQVDAVESGGILRTIAEKWHCPELQTVVRFRDPEEAGASLLLRERDKKATEFYRAHERLHLGDTEMMQNEAVAKWAHDIKEGKDSLLLSDTNDSVRELNKQAQLFKQSLGALATQKESLTTHSGETLYVGDVVMTTLNKKVGTSPEESVRNRNLWTVRSIEDGKLIVESHDQPGRMVTLPRAYSNRNVVLGYALTVDKAQGMTTDTSYAVLNPDTVTSNRLYVSVTRGKENNEVFFSEPTLLGIDFDDEHEKNGYFSGPDEVMDAIISRTTPSPSATGAVVESVEDYLSRDMAAQRFAREQEILLRDYAEYLIQTHLTDQQRSILAPDETKLATLINATSKRLQSGADVFNEFKILTGISGVTSKAAKANKPLEYFLTAQSNLFGSASSLREGRSWVLPPSHPGQDAALLEAARKDYYLGQFSDLRLVQPTQRSLDNAQKRFAAQQNELFTQWARGVLLHNDLRRYGLSQFNVNAIQNDAKAHDALISTVAQLAKRGISLDDAMSSVRKYQRDNLQGLGYLSSPAAGLSTLLKESVEYPNLMRQLNTTPAPRGINAALIRMDSTGRQKLLKEMSWHLTKGATVESIYAAVQEQQPGLDEKLRSGELQPNDLVACVKQCRPEKIERSFDNTFALPDGRYVDQSLLGEAQRNAGEAQKLTAQLRYGSDNPYAALSDVDLKMEVVRLETQQDTLTRHSNFLHDLQSEWEAAPLIPTLPADSAQTVEVSDKIRSYLDAEEKLVELKESSLKIAEDLEKSTTSNERKAAQELYAENEEKVGWYEQRLTEQRELLPERTQWDSIENARREIDAARANAVVSDLTGREMVSQLGRRTDREREKVRDNLALVKAAAAEKQINLDKVWVNDTRSGNQKWMQVEKEAKMKFAQARESIQRNPEQAENYMTSLGESAAALTKAEKDRLETVEEQYRTRGDASVSRYSFLAGETPKVEEYVIGSHDDLNQTRSERRSDRGMEL